MDNLRVHNLDQNDQLNQVPQFDHSQDDQKLQGADNQIAKKGHTVISPTDIINIFPPEIWIQIVKRALPVQGYSFALLLLTMVSTKWMQALASVPTLWAYIDARGSQEDSLATIEVFRRLSCDVPLHLTVHVPTGYDQSMMHTILTSIGARIHEVTITRQTGVSNEETGVVLQLLLTGSQFSSRLAYINLPDGSIFPLDTPTIIGPLASSRLPPSLRGIRSWNLDWQSIRDGGDYLERLENITLYARIESLLTGRIQLPALRSLRVQGYATSKSEDEEGCHSMHNLTSLTWVDGPYREVTIRLLSSVAPQLLHLDLKVLCTKIPLLCAGLQTAINLRNLTVAVREYRGDEGVGELDVCPVYQHISGEKHCLRDLTLIIRDTDELSPAQVERRTPFLSYLMSTISALYTQVQTMEIKMYEEHPITFESVLSYMASLPGIRRLHVRGIDGYFPETMSIDTSIYALRGLEYLNTVEMDISGSLSTPNILSLAFTWGYYRPLDTVRYNDLRKIVVINHQALPVELPESSFPLLQELTLTFGVLDDVGTYSRFNLPSFKFLGSITVQSYEYQPQGTMLCSTAPACVHR